MLEISEIKLDDFKEIWPLLQPTFAAGETYPLPMDVTADAVKTYWFSADKRVFAARLENGEVVGTYYIRPNQPGLGAHICNAGFVVSGKHGGQGIGTAMGRHALETAKKWGYRGMQFNLVAANNLPSLRIWEKLGFEKIGKVPEAFYYKGQKFVDAYILFKRL